MPTIIFSKLSRSLVPSCFALVVASSVESSAVCTENLIRVDDVVESLKLAE